MWAGGHAAKRFGECSLNALIRRPLFGEREILPSPSHPLEKRVGALAVWFIPAVSEILTWIHWIRDVPCSIPFLNDSGRGEIVHALEDRVQRSSDVSLTLISTRGQCRNDHRNRLFVLQMMSRESHITMTLEQLNRP